MTKENERCCHEKEMFAQLNAEDREMYSELDDDAKDFVYYWYYKDYDWGCNKFHDNFLKLTAAEKKHKIREEMLYQERVAENSRIWREQEQKRWEEIDRTMFFDNVDYMLDGFYD